jgi:hypothetical protein
LDVFYQPFESLQYFQETSTAFHNRDICIGGSIETNKIDIYEKEGKEKDNMND